MKTKYWIIIVSILVLINLFSLSFYWKERIIPDQLPKRPTPEKYMRQRVGFSPTQHEKLKVFRNNHFAQIKPIEAELKNLRLQLFVDGTDAENNIPVDSILLEIGRLQRQKDSLTFVHFQDVRSICTPEQAAEFNQIVEEMARRRFGPGRGGMGRDRPEFRNRR